MQRKKLFHGAYVIRKKIVIKWVGRERTEEDLCIIKEV